MHLGSTPVTVPCKAFRTVGFHWRRGSKALLEKIHEALYFYGRPEMWRRIQQNGMAADNSWTAAAGKYVDLYQKIMKL